MFHTIAEASSIIFDLRQYFFADANFKLERLRKQKKQKSQTLKK